MGLDAYLGSKGVSVQEGHCQDIPDMLQDLLGLFQGPSLRVLEIGFNAGHSADAFLNHKKDLCLTSFDIGEYASVRTAKEYIDLMYPGRHTLVLGDSTKSVPAYAKQHPESVFDIMFIDGGHDYEIARADLENCARMAHKHTLVIMDDTIFTPGWEASFTIGPTKAWREAIEEGRVLPLGSKDYRHDGRGMSWGKYLRVQKN